MLGFGPDRDDIAPALMPPLKDGHVSGNRPLQNVGRNRNFKLVGMRRLNENEFAPYFDFWRLFRKVTCTHWPIPSRSLDAERESSCDNNPFQHLNELATFPNVALTTFDNDNWSPLEAA